jgi:hypothetical protein
MSYLPSIENYQRKITVWTRTHYLNLAVYNTLIVILVLLYSAKYFDPYWTISINVIVFFALIASVFLLGTKSRTVFLFSLGFWVIAGVMKILKVEVWAERIGFYVYESLFLGTFLFIIEVICRSFRKRGLYRRS